MTVPNADSLYLAVRGDKLVIVAGDEPAFINALIEHDTMTEPKPWTYFNDGERQGIVLDVHHDGVACIRGGTLHNTHDRTIALAGRGAKLIVNTDALVQPGDPAYVNISEDMRRGWSNKGPHVLLAGTFIKANAHGDPHLAVVELGGVLFPEAPVKLTPPEESTTAPLSAYSVGDIVEITQVLVCSDPPVGSRCKIIALDQLVWPVRVDWNGGEWVQPRQIKLVSQRAAPSQLTIELEKVEAAIAALRAKQETRQYNDKAIRDGIDELLPARAALLRVQEAETTRSVEVTQALAFMRYVELDRKLREVGYQNDCETGDTLRDEMDPCWYAMTAETRELASWATAVELRDTAASTPEAVHVSELRVGDVFRFVSDGPNAVYTVKTITRGSDGAFNVQAAGGHASFRCVDDGDDRVMVRIISRAQAPAKQPMSLRDIIAAFPGVHEVKIIEDRFSFGKPIKAVLQVGATFDVAALQIYLYDRVPELTLDRLCIEVERVAFICNVCKQESSNSEVANDDMPGACDACWQDAQWARVRESNVQATTEYAPDRSVVMKLLDEPAAAYWRAIQTARDAIDEASAQLQEARRARPVNVATLPDFPWIDSHATTELIIKLRKQLPDLPATSAALDGGCNDNGEDRAV
jgi:hypothetical protein